MDWGLKNRIARIISPADNKALMLAVDHGYFLGPTEKLEDLEKKGIKLTKKYDMESNLLEMKGEYESIVAEKEKKNAVKFQGKMLMACITGIEFLNNRFDPFDVKLDGWGEQINENIDDVKKEDNINLNANMNANENILDNNSFTNIDSLTPII